MAEPKTILLDSDIVAYKFAVTNQKNYDWDGDGQKVSVLTDIEYVMTDTIAYVEALKDRLKFPEVLVCLSCPTPENWRLPVLPSYKANRDPALKPLMLTLVKDRLAAHYPSYARPALEADDIMGILSTDPKLVKGKKVIVSEDKDMQTIPGFLFNPRKDSRIRYITEAMADRYHLYQTLIGDTVDNYTGLPGCGPEKADVMLDSPYLKVPYEHIFKRGPRKDTAETRYRTEPTDDLWAGIVSLFEAAGLTEEDALVQARVSRILRSSDYNFNTKEVILWNPPSRRQ